LALLFEGVFVSQIMKLTTCFLMALIISKFALKDIALNAALILIETYSTAGAILFLSFLNVQTAYTAALPGVGYLSMVLGALMGAYLTLLIYEAALSKFEDTLISKVTIECGPCRTNARLLSDSGNLLTTPTGNPITIIRKDLFLSITGLSEATFESYEDYLAFHETLEIDTRKRTNVVSVQSVTGNSLILIYRVDRLVLDGDYYISPAYIGAAQTFKSTGFDGIYNRRSTLNRCKNEDSQLV
jgi:hypothetical protein